LGTSSLTPKENFARSIRCPDDEINLAAASLYAAATEFPDLDVIAYQGRIAQFGSRVKSRLAAHHTNYDFVGAMHEVLFDEAGFSGDSKNYFDPDNSHLNEVIDRLKGNPVALSILYIEVARVAGVAVDGISLRKHFVVAIGSDEERIYIDPFHRGGLLSRKECITNILGKDRVKNGDIDDLECKFLTPASKRVMLRRLLSNLKVAHEKHKQYELALSASERIQLLDPSNLRNLSELAHLQTKIGNFGDAVDSLTQFLERAPAGSNTEQAESALRKLKALTTRGPEDSLE
jgi:regulator of sirC expression with transglutaminase-like and TPR domain|tara:strand:+ start:3103 stop:3972 length:870 start_codon:yes stop_codon:yes gene_type:complete